MNLTTWNKNTPATPTLFAPLATLQQELNRTFEQFFGNGNGFEAYAPYPPVSIAESAEAVAVTAELPGVQANDLDLTVEGNVLMMRGEKKEERQSDGKERFWVERAYGSFARRIQLPAAVDAARAQATLENGVLSLKLPKVHPDKPKAIKVVAK